MVTVFLIGKLSPKLLYPLILSIFCFSSSMAYIPFSKGEIAHHSLILSLGESFALMFCGVFELISSKMNKTNTTPTPISITSTLTMSQSTRKEFHFVKEKSTLKKLLGHIIIIAIIHTIAQGSIIFLRVVEIPGFTDFFKIMNVIFSGLLCYYVFKTKLFLHHIVAIIIIMFSVIITTSFSIVHNFNGFNDIYPYFFLGYIIEVISYATLEVYEKWIMHFKYMSPFLLLFLEGVFNFIIKLILILIGLFIKCPESFVGKFCKKNDFIVNFVSFFKDINYELVLYFILESLLLLGLHISRTLTNKNFTPTHRVVADTLALLYNFIIGEGIFGKEVTEMNKYVYFTVKSFAYVFLIYGCLMYHELIIMGVCKLNENTQVEINKRALKETQKDTLLFKESEQDETDEEVNKEVEE